ncbi:hypothetical protein GS399_17205 [Pedobacter sp. HMF7647]|uniref:Uncharacterized protein n=1 Tax=Hufsiella arboris TaxID=2695275 RepID=A0A7K1YDN7_9SPHI|nr:hypothetical protein [Hufsiella arboris]MXV52713.1 hypothetical protein [Hufsiella arboris]
MSKLKLYDLATPREQILRECDSHYLSRSAEQIIKDGIALNRMSVRLNGDKPIKSPQGKGVIIRRNNS